MISEKLKDLLKKLDEKAMDNDLTQYDEGIRDLLIAIQGGDEDSFADEMLSES